MTNCKELAVGLLDLRLRMLHEPAEQILVSFHKGGQFVLDYLANQKNGISPQKNISRDMIVSSARITVLLKNLEEKGYIRRMKDPSDSRQELVSITESGRDAIGRLRDVLITRTAEVLEALGSHDAEEYFRIQKRIFELTYNTRKDECL